MEDHNYIIVFFAFSCQVNVCQIYDELPTSAERSEKIKIMSWVAWVAVGLADGTAQATIVGCTATRLLAVVIGWCIDRDGNFSSIDALWNKQQKQQHRKQIGQKHFAQRR